MANYEITYEINTEYQKPVKKAFIQIIAIPYNNHLQQIKDLKIESNLKNSEHITKNMFGFEMLQYTSNRFIDHFNFLLKAQMNIETQNPFNFLSWSGEDEWNMVNSNNFYLSHVLYLRETPLTTINKGNVSIFDDPYQKKDLFSWLIELNKQIHNYIEYTPNVTTISTSAHEVMEHKKGVCQDYAHLFIAVVRNYGIPCRYVSGYLNQDYNHSGSGQTHAWVEALLPLNGWIGLDPTNNLLVDHHYIKIAHGTDYEDCSPITGIVETSGKQINEHIVKVINQ